VKLFSKNSNLCDRNTALCTKVHRAVKIMNSIVRDDSPILFEDALLLLLKLKNIEYSESEQPYSLILVTSCTLWFMCIF